MDVKRTKILIDKRTAAYLYNKNLSITSLMYIDSMVSDTKKVINNPDVMDLTTYQNIQDTFLQEISTYINKNILTVKTEEHIDKQEYKTIHLTIIRIYI